MTESNKNNQKNLWTILNQAICKQCNKVNFTSTSTINNKQVSTKSEIAELFNNHFSNIGITTSKNIPKSKQYYMIDLQVCLIVSSYIIETANRLKPKLSSGHDEISTKLLQEILSDISIPITHIINRSLDSSRVPDQLKLPKVIPIYKALDLNQLQNHCPISLVLAFSKLIKKNVYNQVMSFLSSKNILY